jgi:hypothetical protein
MTGNWARRVRFAALAASLGMIGVASLEGQDPREAQVARAFREFDPTARQQLLIPLLNPSLGPLRGPWPVGVQLLAQTLIEDGKDSIAAAWLRWAIRLSPDLRPDTVLFLPEVITALRSARVFVTQSRGPGDSLAVTTWVWPASRAGEPMGRLQIASSGAVPARVVVRGVGGVAAGASTPLSPGSYEISAVTVGSETVRLTREVLPGITTVMEFTVRPPAPQVVTKPPPPRKKSGFPVVWAGLGAAGAVALIAVLTTGGSEPPQTGGITITFPGP